MSFGNKSTLVTCVEKCGFCKMLNKNMHWLVNHVYVYLNIYSSLTYTIFLLSSRFEKGKMWNYIHF